MLHSDLAQYADDPAGALLEICANTLADDIPATITLLKVEGPELDAEEISLAQLSPGWAVNTAETRLIGSAWLGSRSSALLRVPSAIVPEAWNFLLNPQHPDAAAFRIERSYDYPFDLRLKS
jgi:RES domain-containing protein